MFASPSSSKHRSGEGSTMIEQTFGPEDDSPAASRSPRSPTHREQHHAHQATREASEAPLDLNSVVIDSDTFQLSDASARRRAKSYPRVDVMEMQLKLLWEQLQVPSGDQKFYRDVFKRPKSIDDTMKHMVMREIQKLVDYRDLLRSLLAAVDAREVAVEELREFVEAYERHPRFYSASFCESHIQALLQNIRATSLKVMDGISKWRAGTTVQKPLTLRGVNYVVKMQHDLKFLLDSPLGKYVTIELEYNVGLVPRRRDPSVYKKVLTPEQLRERNFMARMSAPQHTIPVSRAAGSLAPQDPFTIQRESERQRNRNHWFSEATAEIPRVDLSNTAPADLNKVAPAKAKDNGHRMFRKSPLDRFVAVGNPTRVAQRRRASSLFGDKNILDYEVDAGATDAFTTASDANSRCTLLVSHGKHWWAVAYYICLVFFARQRMMRRIRRRRAARKIQYWWGTCKLYKKFKVLVSEKRAATCMQKFTRGTLARSMFARMRLHTQSQLCISKCWRCYHARQELSYLRRRMAAVRTLQRSFRTCLNRKRFYKQLRRYRAAYAISQWFLDCKVQQQGRLKRRRHRNAIRIQRFVKSCAAKEHLGILKERHFAATKIQCLHRRLEAIDHARVVAYLATIRRWISGKLADGRTRAHENRVASAVTVQCAWRCSKSKERARRLRRSRQHQLKVFYRVDRELIERRAATLVISMVRGWLVRRKTHPVLVEAKQARAAALAMAELAPATTTLQSLWRMGKAKERATHLRHVRRLMAIWFCAGVLVQRARRCVRKRCVEIGRRGFHNFMCHREAKAVLETQRLVEAAAARDHRRVEAAITIQANVRRFLARVALTAPVECSMVRQSALDGWQRESDAATTIQMAYRSYVAVSERKRRRLVRMNGAATRIQAVWRGVAQRKRYAVLCMAYIRGRTVAAMKIQQFFRFFFAPQ